MTKWIQLRLWSRFITFGWIIHCRLELAWKNCGDFSCTPMIVIFNSSVSPTTCFHTTHLALWFLPRGSVRVWNPYWSQDVLVAIVQLGLWLNVLTLQLHLRVMKSDILAERGPAADRWMSSGLAFTASLFFVLSGVRRKQKPTDIA